MGRIMALDYGTKRTGMAVSDPLNMIANGLDTVETTRLMERLKEIFKEYEIEILVVGEPKKWNNEPSEVETDIQKFMAGFRLNFPSVPLDRWNERFTSSIAQDTLVRSGARKKTRQQKELVDKISATILLQDYLEAKSKRR